MFIDIYLITFCALKVTECQPLKEEQIAGWFVVLHYSIARISVYFIKLL